MVRNKRKVGKVVKIGGLNVWPHEEATAKVLAAAGYVVEFIPKSEKEGQTSADTFIDGVKWELKAPNGSKLGLVENNLRKAVTQAERVVFDSRRVKRIPDKAIARELSAKLKYIAKLKQIKFINRHGEIIDIE